MTHLASELKVSTTCAHMSHNTKLNVAFTLYCIVASAPDSLSLTQDGETTVIVSWTVPTPPGDTTGYRVYYTTDNMIDIIETNSNPITLTSLEPLKEYEISVVGLSEHFSSEPITSSIFLGQFICDSTYIILDIICLHLF